MAATSVAAAVAASQRQTLPPLGMTLLTPPVKKNGILWPSSVGVRVFWVDSPSTACCGPTGHCDGGPYPAFRMWACSKSTPRQSILKRRGGGSERKVRNELLACFFMSAVKSYVAGPHRPLRRQPISSFLDVGMLRNPPRQSILTRRGGGSEAGVRNELLA